MYRSVYLWLKIILDLDIMFYINNKILLQSPMCNDSNFPAQIYSDIDIFLTNHCYINNKEILKMNGE